MSVNHILSGIKADELASALVKAQKFFDSAENQVSKAYSVLRTLNELVYNCNKAKKACKSKGESVFELSSLCCKYISSTWKCNDLGFMQCVYHIKRYLLSQGYAMEARHLCQYYFILKEEKSKTWNSQETIVVKNTFYNFMDFLVEKNSGFYQNLLGEDENSVISWWVFMWKLLELNNYEKLSASFSLTSSFFVKSGESSDSSKHKEFVHLCLQKYTKYFTSSSFRKSNINLSEKDLSSFICLLHTVSFYASEEDLIENILKSMLLVIDGLDPLMLQNDFKYISILLTKTITLCCKENSTNVAFIRDLCKEIDTALLKNMTERKSVNQEVACFLSNLIFKLRMSLCKTTLTLEGILVIFLKIVLKLFSCVRPNLSSPKKKVWEQVNVLYTALYSTFTVVSSKEVLAEVFQDIKRIFKAFMSIDGLLSKNGYLSFGVPGCVNVIISYKRADLFLETATLTKYLMKFFVRLNEKKQLNEIKGLVGYVVNMFALSHGTIGQGANALVGLVALAGVHSEFAELAFKGWAEVKNSHTGSSFSLDTTILDILTNYKETLESEWSPCDVCSLSVDQLLLYEMQSYSKHRSLHKEPVLAVYRTAAKVCTDQMLLAEILVCAVDAVTLQEEMLIHLPSFQQSISNVIQQLLKRQERKEGNEKAYSLWLLGNLYYQQLRCGIMQLRKKSEAEVVQLSIQPKNIVPILQANEGDALNDCSVALAFTYLKLDTQGLIMDSVAKALEFWQKATELLTPEMMNDNFKHSLKFVKATGYLYRLYCFKQKEIETWQMLFNLGGILSCTKYQVIAVAELLNVKFKVDENWIQIAKKAVENEEELDKRSYVHQLFIVSLAKNAFYNQKFEESLKILNSLEIGILKCNFLVYIQHQVLMTRLQSSDSLKDYLKLETKVCPMTAVKVFENLLYIVNNQSWNTFTHLCVIHCLLLDISLFLGTYYADMKFVRHARSYSKQQLTLAQRLAVPIRVSEFLILLGYLDLYCVNTDDCDIKLRGIETILELEELRIEFSSNNDHANPGSPKLTETLKGRPDFLSHPMTCSCYHCINIDYQIQSLQAITLRANYFIVQQLNSEALNLFKVGKDLVKSIRKRNAGTYSEIVTSLAECEVRFFMGMINALEQWKMFDKALQYCDVGLKCMEHPLPSQMPQNLLRYQRTRLKWIKCMQFQPDIKQDLTPERKQAVVECVTPEHRESSAPYLTPYKVSNAPVSPLGVALRRKLVLDLPDEETSPLKEKTNNGIKMKWKIPTIKTDSCDSNGTEKVKRSRNILQKENKTKTTNNVRNNLGINDCRTEKKVNKKNLLSYSPPSGRTSRSAIKIYCDTFDEGPSTSKQSLKSKPKGKQDSNQTEEEDKFTNLKVGRQLKFDIEALSPVESISVTPIETTESRNIISASSVCKDERQLTKRRSQSEGESDLSVIECSPPKQVYSKSNRQHFPITPKSLLKDFESLTIGSTEEKFSLHRLKTYGASKNIKVTGKISENEEHSSLPVRITRSTRKKKPEPVTIVLD